MKVEVGAVAANEQVGQGIASSLDRIRGMRLVDIAWSTRERALELRFTRADSGSGAGEVIILVLDRVSDLRVDLDLLEKSDEAILLDGRHTPSEGGADSGLIELWLGCASVIEAFCQSCRLRTSQSRMIHAVK